MKKSLITLGLALVTSSAFAQSYSVSTDNGLFVAKGLMTSATTVTGVGIDPLKNRSVRVSGIGSVAVSATISTELSDGSKLTSATYAIGTTPAEIVSFSALPPFSVVRVSTTTALTGTQNVSVTVVQ